jgi:hypothetical protein
VLRPTHPTWCNHSDNILWRAHGATIPGMAPCIVAPRTHHADSNYAIFSITSTILARRIFRNTIFLNAPSLCSLFTATVHHSHRTKHKFGYTWVRWWLGDRSSITGNGNKPSLQQYCLQIDSGTYTTSLPISTKDKTTGRWSWHNCTLTMSVIETSRTQKLQSNTCIFL